MHRWRGAACAAGLLALGAAAPALAQQPRLGWHADDRIAFYGRPESSEAYATFGCRDKITLATVAPWLEVDLPDGGYRDGRPLSVILDVDGTPHAFSGVVVDSTAFDGSFKVRGAVAPSGPLVAAFRNGRELRINTARSKGRPLPLDGAAQALETFARACPVEAAPAVASGPAAAPPAAPPAAAPVSPPALPAPTGRAPFAWRPMPEPSHGACFCIPGTADIQLSLTCEAGASPYLSVLLPDGMRGRHGSALSLRLGVDGRRLDARGRVRDNSEYDGSYFLEVPAANAGALLAAMEQGRELSVGNGRRGYRIPLSGFGAAAAHFRQMCLGAPAAAHASGSTAPPAPAGASPATSRAALARALTGDEGDAEKIEIHFVDLNGDGLQEAIVTIDSLAFCGTGGCSYEVYDLSGATPRSLGGFLGFGLRLLPRSTGGWRDLELSGRSGSARVTMRGGSYRVTPRR